jgi:predicted NBD/HSP70 family sugar kinase
MFEWAGDLLGQELANLINLLDPKLIIISEKEYAWEIVLLLHARCHPKKAVPELFENTEIRINTWVTMYGREVRPASLLANCLIPQFRRRRGRKQNKKFFWQKIIYSP